MLKNSTVVITGAGSGLGRSLSIAFSQKGYRVVGVGRREEPLQETEAAIQEDSQFSWRLLDVGDAEAVKIAFSLIKEEFGTIDIVFNNAAVYPKINFLKESPQEWQDAVSINLGGVANVCKAVLPYMIEQDYGKIYNLGSWADLQPIQDSAVYSCTKGAIHSLTKAIAVDIAHLNRNVEVHEWIPGHLNTQMSEYTGMDPSISAQWAVNIVSGQASSKNSIFERDQEWKPPRSRLGKIKDKLLFFR